MSFNTLLRASLVCALSSCTTINNQIADIIFIPNPNSDRRTEKIEIELAYSVSAPCKRPKDSDPVAQGECNFLGMRTDGGAQAMSGFAAADAAQIAKSVLKRALASEAKRYTATFTASASGSQFYHYFYSTEIANEDPALQHGPMGEGAYRRQTDVKFAGFRLERKIDPQRGSDGEKAVAMRICAIALPSQTDDLINVIPVSYDYRFSKAKLIGFNLLSPFGVDLLNPWEAVTNPLSGRGFDAPPADRDIDVTVRVGFEHLYFSDDGLKLVQTNNEEFQLPAVAVTGRPAPGYFPGYARFLKEVQKSQSASNFELPCDKKATPQAIAELRDQIMRDVPLDNLARMQLEVSANPFRSARRSFSPSQEKWAWGNANFTLNVMVTETDDYGAHIAEINDSFEVDNEKTKASATKLWESVQNQLDPNR